MMKIHEIESWAYKIISLVEKTKPIEDNRVELKSEWPTDIKKTARQIAAHANSVHYAPILWLIGLDEEKGIIGAANEEISNWFNAIKSNFDGMVVPELTVLNVEKNSHTITILYFETNRPPYVIKNPEGGRISREVPWREANSTRSAYRHELLSILSPIQKVPSIEILEGILRYHPVIVDMDEKFSWHLNLKMYIANSYIEKLIIPNHMCTASIKITDEIHPIIFSKIWFEHPEKLNQKGSKTKSSVTTTATENEVIIEQAGLVYFNSRIDTKNHIENIYKSLEVNVSIHTIGIPVPVNLKCKMNLDPNRNKVSELNRENIWRYDPEK